MESGILFYWIAWMFWIIITFFMKKGWKRTSYAGLLLTIIIVSDTFFLVENREISLAFLVLIAGAFLFLARMPRTFYHTFIVLTIMIGYVAILFWEQNTPVWVILPRTFIIPLVCTFLIANLVQNFHTRLIVGLVGISSGETLHSLILMSYSLPEPIGEMAFFDSAMVIAIFVFGIEIVRLAKERMALAIKHSRQLAEWKIPEKLEQDQNI